MQEQGERSKEVTMDVMWKLSLAIMVVLMTILVGVYYRGI
jgi:F0F1-type ATP synthase membrane subunit a